MHDLIGRQGTGNGMLLDSAAAILELLEARRDVQLVLLLETAPSGLGDFLSPLDH
ncbi:MAG TPA: hypothetical protein VG146_05805 [Verrucomicrobiae bacterium]|nr:hypothetical protein [Verrucomicrobiae bacterium]